MLSLFDKYRGRSVHRGYLVVVILLSLSGVWGFMAYRNYKASVLEIQGILSTLEQKSPHLTIEECATEVLEQFQNCHVMKNMCQSSVTRFVRVCLAQSDKHQDCQAYGDDVRSLRFGNKQCLVDRAVPKALKKACGDVYSVIAQYCK